MSKKYFALAVMVLAGALFAFNPAKAASGTSYASVSSCENVSTGVRIGRGGGSKYILTNGCRDAGHGVRNYSLSCISAIRYRIIWTEDCAVRDTEAPRAYVTSDRSGYGDDYAVNLFASATDNVAVKRLELYRDGILLTTRYDVGSFNYSIYAGNLPFNTLLSFYTKAYDAAGNVGTSKVLQFYVTTYDHTAPGVLLSHRLIWKGSVETVEITAHLTDDTGLSSAEIFLGTNGSQYNQSSVRYCNLGGARTADCVHNVPKSSMPYGYYWVRAKDTSGNVKDSTLYHYSY